MGSFFTGEVDVTPFFLAEVPLLTDKVASRCKERKGFGIQKDDSEEYYNKEKLKADDNCQRKGS